MDEELQAVAEDIFRDVIASLTLRLRFMDIALNRFIFVPDAVDYRCDGRFFHYSPIAVIKTFRNDRNALARGYLHSVLHCVFQHPFFAENQRPSLYDLACDIETENVILSLGIESLESRKDEDMRRAIAWLRERVPVFTAASICRYLETIENDRVKWMSQIFRFDMHEDWYHLRNVTGSREQLYGEENRDDPAAAGNNLFEGASHDTGEKSPLQGKEEDALIEKTANRLKDWQEISEKIEMDLELFQKENGNTEALVQSLKQLHREKYDYGTFLKKFMRSGEKMQINDAEFEPIFYTYGLSLYGNLPLIEALETKETAGIRELVIAIDTSGSVQGDIVQSFLQKTYDLLMQREHFFGRYTVYIIQCDMVIRDIAVIDSRQKFEAYIQDTGIKGLGGTDFRPVFRWIDEQIQSGAMRRLQGLLYYTDGDGAYPGQKPPYKTAFLFPPGNKDINVPPWAIRYNLEEGETAHAYSGREESD